MESDEKNTQKNEPKIDPELMQAVKQQILEELKSEEVRKAEEAKIRRQKQKEEHDRYVELMKQSSDPWVEIEGWVETERGVRVELDWNDAFVNHLRENGITGTDDEQVVQKWVALLMYDMADQMEENLKESGEFE